MMAGFPCEHGPGWWDLHFLTHGVAAASSDGCTYDAHCRGRANRFPIPRCHQPPRISAPNSSHNLYTTAAIVYDFVLNLDVACIVSSAGARRSGVHDIWAPSGNYPRNIFNRYWLLMKHIQLCQIQSTLLENKSTTWNPVCPVFRTLGKKGSQKGSLHVQEPNKAPYNNQKWF